jgi:CubicO group peptidase (beta-lactamase class C family)
MKGIMMKKAPFLAWILLWTLGCAGKGSVQENPAGQPEESPDSGSVPQPDSPGPPDGSGDPPTVQPNPQPDSPLNLAPTIFTDQWVQGELEKVIKQYKIPALAAAVGVGKHIASGAVGVRKYGSPEETNVNDSFHLGSITKTMTATLIGVLVD